MADVVAALFWRALAEVLSLCTFADLLTVKRVAAGAGTGQDCPGWGQTNCVLVFPPGLLGSRWPVDRRSPPGRGARRRRGLDHGSSEVKSGEEAETIWMKRK